MATSEALLATPSTAITFDAAGTTVVHTLTSLAADAGRQSAGHDFGTSARRFIFEWRAWVQFATAPVVGDSVDWYLKTNDGTRYDNDTGTGDAAESDENKLKNLHYIGSIIVTETAADQEMSASGTIVIYARHIQIVAFNKVDNDALTATSTEHGFTLTPHAIQGQAS